MAVDTVPELKSLLPNDTVEMPPYGLVEQLLMERRRVYGDTAAQLYVAQQPSSVGQMGTMSLTESIRRSKAARGREITMRRMMLRDPVIPRAYRKTTQVVRAGQSLFADICMRIPAILSAKPYQCRMQPVDDDDDSMVTSSLKEDFVHALFLGKEGQRSLLDQGTTSVFRDFMDCLFNLGDGAFSLVARRDRWSTASRTFPKLEDYDDDGEEVAVTKRKSAKQKYLNGVDRYHRSMPPFVLEHLHPQMVYTVQGDDGIEDEAITVAKRPYRPTLIKYGLLPTGSQYNVLTGAGNRFYEIGPNGLGKPYPKDIWPAGRIMPDAVDCVTYYCSARRANDLGLVADNADPNVGVWAYYVDGVCVDYGPLWGPEFHPLPIFYTPGQSTAIPDPNFQGIPPVMHLLELCDLMDEVFTMHLQISKWSAFPPIIEVDIGSGGIGATGLPQDILNDPESIQGPQRGGSKEIKTIQPGNFYSVPAGRRWEYFVMPAEATAHLDTLYSRIRELFDLLGVPSALRGAAGDQSGYGIAQLMIAAKSVYDPIMDNASTLVGKAVKYLLWQVWRRFPEGVPVYIGSDDRAGKVGGWITLKPEDIAPDGKGAGKGTPFLECTVQSNPLFPTDEYQLEQRGINAVAANMIDTLTAREKYFDDPAPEKTEARIIAQKAMQHPVAVANQAYRILVRSGQMLPDIAVAMYAKEFGMTSTDAFRQLASVETFTPEQQAEIMQMIQEAQQQQIQQMQQQAMMGGMMGAPGAPPGPPGMGPPGAPQGPVPQQVQEALAAGGQAPGGAPVPGMQGLTPPPQPPMPPVNMQIQQGMAVGGTPTRQPSISTRINRMMAS